MLRRLLIFLVAAAVGLWPPLLGVAEAGYSSGRSSTAGRSSSSGSRSSSSGSRTSSSSGSSSRSGSYSSGKSYSSSSGKTGSSGSSTSARPGSGGFGSAPARAQAREESRQQYGPPRMAAAPRATYTTPAGRPTPIVATDPPAQYLRSRYDADRYQSRSVRARTFYAPYTQRTITTRYNDPYGPWFWMWLLDRPAHTRATWAYHHRSYMDPVRYQALTSDPEVQREMAVAAARPTTLPATATQPATQPATTPALYVPPGLDDPDLMYADDFVEAVYNPTPTPAAEYTPTQDASVTSRRSGGFDGCSTIGLIAMLIGGAYALICFFNRRSATRPNVPPLPIRRPAPPPPSFAPRPAPPYNPLNLHVGQTIRVHHVDHLGREFRIEEVRYHANHIAGAVYPFATYTLAWRPGGDKAIHLQLRVEEDDTAPAPTRRPRVLLMRLHEDISRSNFEQKYEIDLYQIVETDRTGQFQVTNDDTGEVEAEYFRPEGVLSSFKPAVTVLRDVNRDGAVTSNEARPLQLEYWDYARETATPDGTPFREYLVVELEEEAWWRIWIGSEIQASTIRV